MANFYCSMYHLMLLVSVLAADLLLADWIPRLSREFLRKPVNVSSGYFPHIYFLQDEETLSLSSYLPRSSPGPPVYGSMLSKRDLSPRFRKVRAEILNQHNFYRSMVDPPAQNMQEMVRRQSRLAFHMRIFGLEPCDI